MPALATGMAKELGAEIDDNAAELLAAARERTLAELRRAAPEDLEAELDTASDSASQAVELTSRMVDEALAEELSERLAAIERAEQRLAEGTYGRSIDSGRRPAGGLEKLLSP